MKKALEGLKGVTKVEMDVEHDLFRVSISEQNSTTQQAVFAVIKDLGYDPSAAPVESFRATQTTPRPIGEAPEIVRQALDKAKVEKKFVLVYCMGDN